MQTEISPYSATGYRDALARLALQRANIMHLVDLKRGGYSPRRTEMRNDTNRLSNSANEIRKAVDKVPPEITIKFFSGFRQSVPNVP